MSDKDMSDMIQKMSQMFQNGQIPDNIKNIMSSFTTETNNSTTNSDSSNENSNSSSGFMETDSTNNNSDMPNLDIDTMLKMKSIIDSMNKQQNDPRSNLLKSLKPYLRPSRKDKVDQYIKLFSMGKVFEMMGPLNGEKKNDV